MYNTPLMTILPGQCGWTTNSEYLHVHILTLPYKH